jgi:hypothetical protein
MIHLPRRYFFQAMNERHYKKRSKTMGGPEYRILQPHEIAAFTRGEESTRHTVQDSIDSLNAAIDRLDQIINEMKEMGQTDGNNK